MDYKVGYLENMKMERRKFDTNIVFEFIPDNDKKSFMVWDNIFLSGDKIVAIYRAPFEEKIYVSLTEYELRVKQKERDIKLNKLC